MCSSVSNNDNVIDSRDVIGRMEELESDLVAEYDELELVLEAIADDYAELQDTGEEVPPFSEYYEKELNGKPNYVRGGELITFLEWVKLIADDMSHDNQDEAIEYLKLKDLADQAEGYGDWSYGETLIHEAYFQRYAEELAKDTGAINEDSSWPNNCIDWEQAASELQVDYMSVDFDGETYWMRA